MSIVKISDLPAADSPVSPSDVAAVVQNGVTKKAAIQQFGYSAFGAGAINRTIQDKLRETVSVTDFGAVGDGVTDDTVAIQNAINSLALTGGVVNFPPKTYKVTTVFIQNIDNITIEAGSAEFTSQYGSVFAFLYCDDFTWRGGVINGGVGANPAFAPGSVTSLPQNLLVFGSNRVMITEARIINNPANVLPCITAWNVTDALITNNECYYGGDNTIWIFGLENVTVSNNLVIGNERGRAICFQQVNNGAITGNQVMNGKGDGLNVHGSANIAITGNSVYNMATDSVILGLSSGVGIEWDENATSGTVAAAVADPTLYNRVFCRNITVSGNTIAKCGFGVRIGNNVGIAGANYGNQGQVVIDGNNIFDVSLGFTLGTSRQIRISSNMVARVANACIEINTGTDTGGYAAEDIYVDGNRFSDYNRSNLGFSAIRFTPGTPAVAKRFFFSDNEFDQPAFSAAVTNISNTLFANMQRDTSVINGVVSAAQDSSLKTQVPFADQAGAATMNSYITTGASHTFTQSGSVGDSFTTVLTLPDNASIMAHIQIGSDDRLGTWGMILAQNGDTPSLSFTGTGSGNVQMSGANLQIKGNTSGGTAAYGGVYTIRYSLVKPN